MNRNQNALKLEHTGDPSFDQILGGGIPAQSVVVIAGAPGSGKTILTLQMLFRAAKQGKKCLYLTTLSEPPLKVIRYMQFFDFFDEKLIGKQIVMADLGGIVRKGSEAILTELTGMIEKHKPEFVAIDSFRALIELIDRGQSTRSFIYDLATQNAAWGATTLLVGEYIGEDFSTCPEFGIADGILRLGAVKQELTSVRELEVLKLRGMDYVSGRHFLEITKRGVFVYPRVRAPRTEEEPRAEQHERISSGVKGFDELFGGGVPRASTTVLHGPSGCGKTVLALQFLVEGARKGEPGIYFTLEETPNQLRALGTGLGWDIPELERKKLLVINYVSPVELSTDRYLQTAREEVRARNAQRAVFDSLTSMKLGVPSERRFKELVYSMSKHMRADGVTLFMVLESEQLLGTVALSGGGISFISDNLAQLRYVEVGGGLERAISILKSRGIKHETHLRLLKIGQGGIQLSSAGSRNRRGVLSGKTAPKRRPKS